MSVNIPVGEHHSPAIPFDKKITINILNDLESKITGMLWFKYSLHTPPDMKDMFQCLRDRVVCMEGIFMEGFQLGYILSEKGKI